MSNKLTPDDFFNGQVILVNKPKTWTSFDVVNKMRIDLRHQHQIPYIKIGHAGTLDPLATGLLIICIGRQTKNIFQYQGLEKEYTGTMMLGATTPSYDMETQINERYSIAHITPELINETAKKFVGSIWQYPPNFSAKWVQGDRAYNIARSGGQPDVKPVLVNIAKFEIVSVLLPMIEFKVVCAKGTYIRSLAHDFGRQLGCGALLASLNRTRIGQYKLKDAKEVKNWLEAAQPSVPKKRIPPKTAARKAEARKKERAKISSPAKPAPAKVKLKAKKTVAKKKSPAKVVKKTVKKSSKGKKKK